MSAHPRAPLRHAAPHLEAWLPHAALATACVVIAPALTVSQLVPPRSAVFSAHVPRAGRA